jgi:hypothetical protein
MGSEGSKTWVLRVSHAPVARCHSLDSSVTVGGVGDKLQSFCCGAEQSAKNGNRRRGAFFLARVLAKAGAYLHVQERLLQASPRRGDGRSSVKCSLEPEKGSGLEEKKKKQALKAEQAGCSSRVGIRQSGTEGGPGYLVGCRVLPIVVGDPTRVARATIKQS